MAKKEYRLITFDCEQCGVIIKAYLKGSEIRFLIDGKEYSEKEMITELGYFVCNKCFNKNSIRFEFVYK